MAAIDKGDSNDGRCGLARHPADTADILTIVRRDDQGWSYGLPSPSTSNFNRVSGNTVQLRDMLALSGNQTGMGRVFGTQAILYIRHSNWQANMEEILIRCCERYSVRILLQVFLFIFATYVARYN